MKYHLILGFFFFSYVPVLVLQNFVNFAQVLTSPNTTQYFTNETKFIIFLINTKGRAYIRI